MGRFVFPCPLRWGDMDAFGHVNNVSYLSYLEEARTAMLFTDEAAEAMPLLQRGVVVARHEIDYRRPLDWRPEPIDIHVWVSEMRSASFSLRYELYDGEMLVAEALTVCVPFDLEAGKPRRLEHGEREFLERFYANGHSPPQ
jgi:acyl-CoA thioester hydrolase